VFLDLCVKEFVRRMNEYIFKAAKNRRLFRTAQILRFTESLARSLVRE
jgi:hypothetical protein